MRSSNRKEDQESSCRRRRCCLRDGNINNNNLRIQQTTSIRSPGGCLHVCLFGRPWALCRRVGQVLLFAAYNGRGRKCLRQSVQHSSNLGQRLASIGAPSIGVAAARVSFVAYLCAGNKWPLCLLARIGTSSSGSYLIRNG